MRSVWLVCAALLGIAAVSLQATTYIPTEFRELVNDAHLIVRGRVTDVRPVPVPRGGIDSVATVAVGSVLKAELPDLASAFINVRVPGGTLGRYRTVAVGAPTFAPGQQAVFFLVRTADGFLRPVGLSMGVYRLRAEAANRRVVVDAPVMLGHTASAGPIVRGDRLRKPLPVPDFEALVRLVVAAPRAGVAGRRQ